MTTPVVYTKEITIPANVPIYLTYYGNHAGNAYCTKPGIYTVTVTTNPIDRTDYYYTHALSIPRTHTGREYNMWMVLAEDIKRYL
jgi:hypothetical protein